MRTGLLIMAVMVALASAAPAKAAGGECLPGSDISGCVLVYHPPGDGGSGGDCATPTDYRSCLAACDCQYNKNLDECDGQQACVNVATSERNACKGNCIADYPS